MSDFALISPQDFETLIVALLGKEGFEITQYDTRSAVRGPDIVAISPSGETVFVEVKHFRQLVPSAMVTRFIADIERYREHIPGAHGLLVLSGGLTRDAEARVAAHSDFACWTGADVARRLAQYPSLLSALQAAGNARQSLASLAMLARQQEAAIPESEKFSARLVAIEKGERGWRHYEDWCTEIISEIFRPDLGPPDTQIRTDDNLDIMDAIFPIRSNIPPWSLVRSEYETRFVVAEFKNYGDSIGQRQVESIAQYLWPKAKRMFGILISRRQPGQSAVAQRRRFWLDQEKMIVMLTDADLIEMLQMREGGENPFDVIDAQLEEFLRTLTP